MKGSVARRGWMAQGGDPSGYGALHARLVEEGILTVGDAQAVFAEDYAFRSPSAAGAVLNGRSCNGRLEWKRTDDGRSYGEWERDELAATA